MKIAGYLLTPLFYLCFGLCLGICHPIQWIAYKAFGYGPHKRVVDGMNFFLTYCQWLLGSSISFKRVGKLPTDVPVIFISNHQSMYDIPALIWFLRKNHVKFISKIELTKGIPSISFNLKHGGGANIDRRDSKQAVSEILRLGKRMKSNNWSTLIFAEGTRARDGKLKPFQVGGIATLLKVVPNALVVPVAIENSWKVVRWGSFPLGTFLSLKWTVLPAVQTGSSNAEEITAMAEQAIRTQIGQ